MPEFILDPWVVLAALMLEAGIGYPATLNARLPHPVTWIGTLLSVCEKHWNVPSHTRKLRGVVTVIGIAALAGTVGFGVSRLFSGPAHMAVVIIIGTVGLAQRSLHDHVTAVAAPLRAGDLGSARAAVARIVGRDVQGLDAAGVAGAALESLSESFNDGVVAPAFWFLIGGLPGLFIYKVVNTADSMIGHKEPRWRDFGLAAARTDDLLNLIPARIAGVLIVAAEARGWRVMWADAMKHASPNAGWPEAAMAGALRVRLGGPAQYDGIAHERPVFGTGAAPSVNDLARGLVTYRKACGVLWVLLLAGGILWRL